MSCVRVFSVLCVAVTLTACGGSNTSPTTTAPAQSCRTYATSSTTLTTISTGVGSSSRTLMCSFNNANQLACTMTISSCGAVSFTVNYASRSDFVDEVSVIPPRMLQMSQTTATNACGITNASYAYDGQKRLLNYTINGLTYSYSAWESGGRPTSGLVTGPAAPVTESWSYNDGARSATLVQSNSAGSTTANYLYDSNGNPASVIVVSGGTTAASTTATAGTAQVCK